MERVAPRRGAWIEITAWKTGSLSNVVAPRRGAWIEIQSRVDGYALDKSLPAGERGLKLTDGTVVSGEQGRSPQGSVD